MTTWQERMFIGLKAIEAYENESHPASNPRRDYAPLEKVRAAMQRQGERGFSANEIRMLEQYNYVVWSNWKGVYYLSLTSISRAILKRGIDALNMDFEGRGLKSNHVTDFGYMSRAERYQAMMKGLERSTK